MKIFSKENDKEVVFIQYDDLRFLYYNEQTLEKLKNYIPMSACSLLRGDEYMKFDNEEIVKWIKDSYFILDFDKFSAMSNQDIFKEYKDVEKKIDKVILNLKNIPKKERKNQVGLFCAYDCLMHYKNEILKFLRFEEINLPNGKTYINKKDNA